MINKQQLLKLNDKGVFNILDSGSNQIIKRVADGGLNPLNAANINFPAGLLTNISPKMVEVILRERTAEKVTGGKSKLLDWQQNDLIVTVAENTGETKAYSDFDNAPVSGTNPTFVRRGHARFSAGVQIGRLQSMQASEARISLEQRNLNAALEALAIKFNNIAFNGTKESNSSFPIYGILNDPDIPAIKKTNFKSDGTATFKQVYDDFRAMIQELIVQSGNHLDLNSKYRVCISNNIYLLITEINDLGTTPVIDALKAIFPNITFEMIPEFEKAHSGTNDVIYVIAENDAGGIPTTCELGFSELGLASNTVAYENHTSQVLSSGSTGVIFYKPYNVVRRYVASA